MISWKMTISLVAIALCTGATTITTSTAHAEDADEVTEDVATSEEALVSEPDAIIVNPYADNDFDGRSFTRDDDYNRRSFEDNDGYDDRTFDRDWHRRGYGSCFAYCDDVRDACMRRYYRGGYDHWRGGRRDRWDRRHRGNAGYRRCEQRFDYCLDSCRNDRWRGRGR